MRKASLLARLVAGCTVLGVVACTGGTPGSASAPSPDNQYRQVNLAANNEGYQARVIIPEMVDAWGVAIRTKGKGGGEEDSLNKEQEKVFGCHPDKGKLVEFTNAGKLVRIVEDDGCWQRTALVACWLALRFATLMSVGRSARAPVSGLPVHPQIHPFEHAPFIWR
ncbi:MAG TPA: hypothetical protein VIY28_08380 [Pseudonocardiaceae bacterium]